MPDSAAGTPILEDASTNEAGGEDRLLPKLLEASSCERDGRSERAVQLYREIVAEDAEGTWGQSARKALEALGVGEVEAQGAETTSRLPQYDESEMTSLMAGDADDGDETRANFGERSPNFSAPAASVPVGAAHQSALLVEDSSLTRLRWSALAATALPVVALSAAALWWIPSRFEQRFQVLETGGASLTTTVLRQEVEALVVRQRLWGLAAGIVALGAGAVSVGLVARTLSVRLGQLARRESGYESLAGAKGELGDLARTLADLEGRVLDRERQLAAAERGKQADLEAAMRETQRLQQQVIELLVQIEEVRNGNLTARAPTIDGKVGSIADAFNATIDSLRYIVTQVIDVTESLTEGARGGEVSVRQVSDSALQQSEALQEASENVAEMVSSIDRVSELTQSSAQVAREAIEAAREGDLVMDRTVVSMDKIRTAVSNTSKRAKRLAEAAQEVSQILAIVTGISEQANLLAFNASIEAARAGEQGQGFRQVSEEVRNLAAQVSESAGDIERLVQSIQEETSSVIDVLEVGTSEVVSGTQFVSQTQKTLSHLSALSRQIDASLQHVAANTNEQTKTSQQVNQTMQSVASVSLENAQAAQEVVTVLKQLLTEVSTLQRSVDRFQV